MADYKELLRKAIAALPENNGAARRAVYEKARSALVAQLRALNPPLPAREITQHRLQLEDCIRQVEQEASEQVAAGLIRHGGELPQLAAPAETRAAQAAAPAGPEASEARAEAHPAEPPARAEKSGPMTITPPPSRRIASSPGGREAAPRPASRVAGRSRTSPASIEDIIAAANEEFPETGPEPQAGHRRAAHTAEARPAAPPRARRVIEVVPEPVEQASESPEIGEEEAAAHPAPERDVRAGTVKPAEDVGERQPAASAEERQEPEAAPRNEGDGEEAASKPDNRPQPREREAAHRREVEPGAGRPPRALPAIVARAEAMRTGRSNAPTHPAVTKPHERDRRGPAIEPRREVAASGRSPAVARQAVAYGSAAAAPKLQELEIADNDPQSAIDRAIATLDREARGESAPLGTVVEMPRPAAAPEPEPEAEAAPESAAVARAGAPGRDDSFAPAPIEDDRGGSSAITIFLLIFLVLLMAAGGGAFWAWHEGYIDFAAMFGKPAQERSAATALPTTPKPAGQPASPLEAAPAASPAPAPKAADRLESAGPSSPAPAPSAPAQLAPSAPSPAPASPPAAEVNAPDTGEVKSEDRLTETPAAGAEGGQAALPTNPAAVPGSQSLLLEASDDGTTGAVPFSGTVDWTQGKDELGQPTLIGKATIPARNLSVTVLIRKNSDPTLPASHLMEVNFKVSDSFIGGSIAGLPGVLLKNEELVQGTPLVGASARVVGNSFLFALSSAPDDMKTNINLLTSRKWMDLAIIYATGKRAIITLEKDEAAQSMFDKVFAEWAKPAATPPAAPPAGGGAG